MSNLRTHIFHCFSICLLCLIGILMIACNPTPKMKPVVTVSIQPQKYILEKIVGDKIEIMCLLSQGSNPEAYEPNLSHLINLEKSDAYFRIGNIGFELAIINKAKNNNSDLKIYDNSEGVKFLSGCHGASGSDGHKHEIDPHIWSSIPNTMIIAENMHKAMIDIDPKNAKFYSKNYATLRDSLFSLNQKIATQLEPLRGTAFAVWHPSLSYFAQDYGLEQISLEYDSKEAPIKHIQKQIKKAKDAKISVFFYQKEFDSRQAEVLNEQIGAKIITINPMNYNWEEEIYATANALTSK